MTGQHGRDIVFAHIQNRKPVFDKLHSNLKLIETKVISTTHDEQENKKYFTSLNLKHQAFITTEVSNVIDMQFLK